MHVRTSHVIGYHSLLRGDTPPTSPTQSDHILIPGDARTPPASPPTGNLLITAQVEATVLTQVRYNTITSLVCSLLHLPTGDLVFDGYTLNPFTLYWHCTGVDEKRVPCFPLGIVSNMINQRIGNIRLGARVHCLPGENVSITYWSTFQNIHCVIICICRRWHFLSPHGMEIYGECNMCWSQEQMLTHKCQYVFS